MNRSAGYKIIHLLNLFILGFMMVLVIAKTSNAEAKTFGKYGNSFEIKEEGFLEMIYRKLKAVDIKAQQEKMTIIARKSVEEPNPIERIRAAMKNREYIFDPTYELDEDIVSPDGAIIYLAGTRINPLDKIVFDRKLYFIDARKEEQIDWLKTQLEEHDLRNKIYEKIDSKADNTREIDKKTEARVILIGGRPHELSIKLGREVYFDQFGELSTRFKIECVPATLEQEGKVLKIKEININ